MSGIYKSAEAQRQIEEAYRGVLNGWPVPCRQLRVPTAQGETFVIASGSESAPPVLLLHGSMANCAAWIGDVALWAERFRVFAVDVIGEPGFSAPSRPRLGSPAYAQWLDDVMAGLGLERTSLVGVSLGGWLALDYATANPERIESLALVCPGGVGRQRNSILLKYVLFILLGEWGRRKMLESILGPAPADRSPELLRFQEMFARIHRGFRPRMEQLPIFEDAALRRLTMPVLAIVGGQDVLLDSAGTRRRLEALLEQVEVRFLPDARHYIPGQGSVIADFLSGAVADRATQATAAAASPGRSCSPARP